MVVTAPTSIEIYAPADRVWRTLVEPDLVARYVDGGSGPGQGAAEGMIASGGQPVVQKIERVAQADDGG